MGIYNKTALVWNSMGFFVGLDGRGLKSCVKHVRLFLTDGSLPQDEILARATRQLASKMHLDEDRVWAMKKVNRRSEDGEYRRVEVLDTVERTKEVLIMIHDGMGHRGSRTCYVVFIQRFWIPAAAKIIERHISACRQCQQFSKPNPLATPGYGISPTDIFSYWSIDFAGPFLEDVATGARFAILAVETVDETHDTTEVKKAYWVPLLQSVLWAYRSTPHTVTGASPAMLTLGTELRMPIDLTISPIPAPQTDEDHRALITKCLQYLYDTIPGLREVKEAKNSKMNIQFQLGDKVWKRESKYDAKGFTLVFAPHWTGPFVIHAVWDKNVYKLRTDPLIIGKKVGYLKNPINGYRLKPYIEGELVIAVIPLTWCNNHEVKSTLMVWWKIHKYAPTAARGGEGALRMVGTSPGREGWDRSESTQNGPG
ncbi:hypothetical protein BGX38DRAFT_1299370 [Terfezia claveryi]|nr:hypothetical protein BGX38DRAFT_1299370 [Terfezia claveryi]